MYNKLTNILIGCDPVTKLTSMLIDGSLHSVLPELVDLIGVEQPPEYHPEGDVWTHTMMMVDDIPDDTTVALAWAILLHDIAKPVTQDVRIIDGECVRWCFHDHAVVGADMATNILRRLGAPDAVISDVYWLISNHIRFNFASNMKERKLVKLFNHPLFKEGIQLAIIDGMNASGDISDIISIFNKLRQYGHIA